MSATLVIKLPNGRSVGLGTYVAAWKQLRALPSDLLVPDFFEWPTPAGEILERIRHGVHDRVNRHLSWWQNAKLGDDYQRGLVQDTAQLNQPRLRIHYLNTPCLRARFVDRLRHAEAANARVGPPVVGRQPKRSASLVRM